MQNNCVRVPQYCPLLNWKIRKITYAIYHVWRDGMGDYAKNMDQRDALRPDGGRQ